MLSARRDCGNIIRLTRLERALLLRLVRQPQTLVTRAQLLEALGDDNTGALSERNIDYLINRLRKRLGETARKPRFIVTQYGEGYYWAVEPETEDSLSAFLLIGPIYGLEDGPNAMNGFAHHLTSEIRKALDGEKTVLCRPDWRHVSKRNDALDYSLDISTHMDADDLHLAMVLREGRTRQVIDSFRRTFPLGQKPNHVRELSRNLIEALWRHNAFAHSAAIEPNDRPMHLRMHDAAVMLTNDTASWRENAERLRKAHEEDRENPRISVMLALNHYARLLQSLAEIHNAPIADDEWQGLETEIESLCLRALPDAYEDPQLLLAIAKLLRFIDRGYFELAHRLTEKAFRDSTAFAACFSMKAQIAASKGEIDEAVSLYDKAIELSEPGSQFHIYLIILKAVALMADDRRGAVEHIAIELQNVDAASQAMVGLFLISPKSRQLPAPLEHTLSAISPEHGRYLTRYLFRISARQFQRRSNQRNIMHGIMSHLIRIHGGEAIDPELTAKFPEIMSQAR